MTLFYILFLILILNILTKSLLRLWYKICYNSFYYTLNEKIVKNNKNILLYLNRFKILIQGF